MDNPWFWILAIAGVILTGISKSGFAGGPGVLAVPLISLAMPVGQAAAVLLPVLLVMDSRTVYLYRKHVDLRLLRTMLPGAIVGIALGGILLGELSEKHLQLGLGILCFVFAAWGSLTPLLARLPGAAFLWSGLAGTTSTLIHAGGPPMNVYLLSLNMPKLLWLGTAGVFFAVVNLTKLVPYTLLGQWNREVLLAALVLAPISFIGVNLGHKLQAHLSQESFARACRYLLVLSALVLIYKAVGMA